MINIGDKVISKYTAGEEAVVRTITEIYEEPAYGSGFWASADGGEPCQCCGKRPGFPIRHVDSGWFKPVK